MPSPRTTRASGDSWCHEAISVPATTQCGTASSPSSSRLTGSHRVLEAPRDQLARWSFRPQRRAIPSSMAIRDLVPRPPNSLRVDAARRDERHGWRIFLSHVRGGFCRLSPSTRAATCLTHRDRDHSRQIKWSDPQASGPGGSRSGPTRCPRGPTRGDTRCLHLSHPPLEKQKPNGSLRSALSIRSEYH